MNRLWFRLSVSFVLVTWLVIAVVAGLMRDSVQTNFGNFLNTSNSLRFGPDFVHDLESFYATNDTWQGIDTLFPDHQITGQGKGQGDDQGQQGMQSFVANTDDLIVYASNPTWIGQTLSDIGSSRVVDLSLNGEIIGILGEQTPGTVALNEAESQFLQDTATGLFLTALGGGLLAFIVGIFIARSLSRPLQNLATQVEQITVSNLGQNIQTNGTLEISQLSGAFNDLSFRLAAEEDRRQRMTGDIAHELRTPITVMRGLLEAMLDGIYALDVQHLAVVYDQILHLSRLVEDMRLVARAEAGQLTLDKTLAKPEDLILQAAQRFQPLVDDSVVHLKTDIAPQLPTIDVDVNRIQQVLDNLITNALRHTSENGDIILSSYRASNGNVIIRVHNTGKPIPVEHIERIFDRFWRADEARERDVGGTGLGLAITKLLVELHGGHIHALSLTKGASFEISLPASSKHAK